MQIIAQLTTKNLHFGPKIFIGFPKDFDDYEAMDIAREINMFLAERLGGGERGAEGLRRKEPEGFSQVVKPLAHVGVLAPDSVAEKEDAVSSLAEWPSVGMVTVSDIVKFWNIGRSSFRNRVREGIFSKAVDCPDRAFNAPKVWDAAVVGAELAKAGYVRRGF